MSMPIDLLRGEAVPGLSDLPYFDQLAGLLVGVGPEGTTRLRMLLGERFLTSGTMNFEEERPYSNILLLIEMLVKARAIADLRSVDPILNEGYSRR